MKLLEGKTAVITGSSRGLGFAIAQAFAEQGAKVMLAARTQETLTKAIENLRIQGVEVHGQVCDVSKQEDVQNLAQSAISTFGGFDIWVNNAGVSAPYGPILSFSPDYFNKVVNTNIQGVFYGSYTALKYFQDRGSGKLINLLGRGADGPVPYQTAYAASKAWGKNFTAALAKETTGNGVEVMSFNPGLVITDMLTRVDTVAGFEDKVLPLNTVIRLWGNRPEIPARKMVWMASSATNGKNGLSVNFLNFGRISAGLLREAWRLLLHKPATTPTIQVRVVS